MAHSSSTRSKGHDSVIALTSPTRARQFLMCPGCADSHDRYSQVCTSQRSPFSTILMPPMTREGRLIPCPIIHTPIPVATGVARIMCFQGSQSPGLGALRIHPPFASLAEMQALLALSLSALHCMACNSTRVLAHIAIAISSRQVKIC